MLLLPVFLGTLFFITSVIFLILFVRSKQELVKQTKLNKAIWGIDRIILNTLDFEKVADNIVNAALIELSKFGYVILVLSLNDLKRGVMKRISISKTAEATEALKFSPISFSSIEIPLNAKENTAVKAITENKPQETDKLADLLFPLIDPKLAWEAQRAAQIKTSIVYPVTLKGQILGTLIFSTKKESKEISWYEREIMLGFVDAVGIAIENATLVQKLKITDLQLERANEKLKQLDKLKDDFVSVASHELRTPMTAIKSYLWMGLNRPDAPLSEKMNKYLSRAYISTERLINLVNDMLNVSRIEAGRIEIRPKIFDLQALCTEVLAEIAPKLQEKMINVEMGKNPIPAVFADPDKVHQVLLNLLGNALKFTPVEGKISVSFFTDGLVVEAAIKDSGVGIDKDDLSRLFQKFGRLDNSYVAAATSGGTGLGLFISKSLIDLMRGKIWASSDGLGKGTTFIFALPAATPDTLSQADQYTKKVIGEAKILEPVAI